MNDPYHVCCRCGILRPLDVTFVPDELVAPHLEVDWRERAMRAEAEVRALRETVGELLEGAA